MSALSQLSLASFHLFSLLFLKHSHKHHRNQKDTNEKSFVRTENRPQTCLEDVQLLIAPFFLSQRTKLHEQIGSANGWPCFIGAFHLAFQKDEHHLLVVLHELQLHHSNLVIDYHLLHLKQLHLFACLQVVHRQTWKILPHRLYVTRYSLLHQKRHADFVVGFNQL